MLVRRDNGETCEEFLKKLASEAGIETPTREQLAQMDRKRNKKMSNQDWTNLHDPDAKITKMKDGSTHLAHKVEHAVDIETGAVVAHAARGRSGRHNHVRRNTDRSSHADCGGGRGGQQRDRRVGEPGRASGVGNPTRATTAMKY